VRLPARNCDLSYSEQVYTPWRNLRNYEMLNVPSRSFRKGAQKRFMAEQDDELLLKVCRARDGDLRAFEQLVRQYQGRIVADCRHIIRDENNAEDLAQEVFVKAYFGLRRFEGRSSFRHWLQRIKVNHCLNYLKKQEGYTLVSFQDGDAEEDAAIGNQATADSQADAMGDRQLISKILDSMSATMRIPLILRDMDELSYEEIATALGISLSAVKMRIKRAREEFRSRYRAHAEPAERQRTA
jgi:RNA polymerase sigma-70 factor (ECF subfamily)